MVLPLDIKISRGGGDNATGMGGFHSTPTVGSGAGKNAAGTT